MLISKRHRMGRAASGAVQPSPATAPFSAACDGPSIPAVSRVLTFRVGGALIGQAAMQPIRGAANGPKRCLDQPRTNAAARQLAFRHHGGTVNKACHAVHQQFPGSGAFWPEFQQAVHQVQKDTALDGKPRRRAYPGRKPALAGVYASGRSAPAEGLLPWKVCTSGRSAPAGGHGRGASGHLRGQSAAFHKRHRKTAGLASGKGRV